MTEQHTYTHTHIHIHTPYYLPTSQVATLPSVYLVIAYQISFSKKDYSYIPQCLIVYQQRPLLCLGL